MNEMASWEVGEVLSKAWDLTKSHIGLILGVFVVMALLIGVSYGLFYALGMVSVLALSDSAAGPILMIVFTLLGALAMSFATLYLSLNLIRFFLKIVRGQGATIGDLFGGIQGLGSLILASILISIASSIASIVVVGPFIVGLACFFVTFLIADKGTGPIEAIKESVKIAWERWFDILIWMLVVLGINFVGALACGLGQLVTAPLTMIGSLIIYDRVTSGGGMPAPGMPLQGGGMQQGGGMPPQGGGMQQGGGMPPQGGGMQQGGGMPPQGGGMPPQGGGYPPQGGMPPQGGF